MAGPAAAAPVPGDQPQPPAGCADDAAAAGRRHDAAGAQHDAAAHDAAAAAPVPGRRPLPPAGPADDAAAAGRPAVPVIFEL